MSTATAEEIKSVRAKVRGYDDEIAAQQASYDETLAAAREKSGGDMGALLEADPELAARLTEEGKSLDDLKDKRVEAHGFLASLLSGQPRSGGSFEAAGHAMSAVDMLLADPAYARMTADFLHGSAQIGSLPAVEVLEREQFVRRLRSGGSWFAPAAAATADLDAGIPLDQRLFPPVDILRRRITLLDLITVGQTNTDAVVYAQQTTRDSAAAETALGTAYGEASFAWQQVTANVKSIGHFTTAYRENIADAAQFDTIVRQQLQEDVMLRVESQVYAGNGSGQNLAGITANGSIASVTRDTTNETRLDVIHRAITQVRLAYREPDGVLVHPNDYHAIVAEKSSGSGEYLYPPNPAMGTPATIWGLPAVVSPVASEGSGMVAYWRDATLWVRSGVSLSVSDSHSDYFTKRQVAILAEMRAAFSVQRPGVFCKVLSLS